MVILGLKAEVFFVVYDHVIFELKANVVVLLGKRADLFLASSES